MMVRSTVEPLECEEFAAIKLKEKVRIHKVGSHFKRGKKIPVRKQLILFQVRIKLCLHEYVGVLCPEHELVHGHLRTVAVIHFQRLVNWKES